MDKRLFIPIVVIVLGSILLASGMFNYPAESVYGNSDGYDSSIEDVEYVYQSSIESSSDQAEEQDDNSVDEETTSFAGLTSPLPSNDHPDNGEADNGEADNGEADNGEADNGEADNGEADNGEKVNEETVIDPAVQEIPEFPTIALPMLAIIGLAFFFRRNQ